MMVEIEDGKNVLPPFGYTHVWDNVFLNGNPPGDQLIRRLGWIVGSDAEGRTLYHFSIEDCRDLLQEYENEIKYQCMKRARDWVAMWGDDETDYEPLFEIIVDQKE